MNKLVFACMLVLGFGCEKREAPPTTNSPAATPKAGETPTASSAPAAEAVKPEAVPAAGGESDGNKEISLEEATAGLEGKGKLRVEFKTQKGTIHCELYGDQAPKTVASFVGLARGLRPYRDPESGEWKKGSFFDGLAFHRVIPDFMIQGGDPLSRNYQNAEIGTGRPGFTLPDETSNNLRFDKPGRMAMANSGSPTTAGSQFFITEAPRPHLDGKYTIFGQCDDKDVDIVKQIARVPVDTPNHNKPVDAVTMEVKILKK
jgi:peptidyl-prolyl cis-trans isomerase A (cyclophilin A)